MSDPQPAFARLDSQQRFLCLRDGSLGVDRLFCYEDIGRFVGFLEARLDFEIHLPRVNVSPAGATPLSPAAEARLHAHMAPDLELYRRVQAGETA